MKKILLTVLAALTFVLAPASMAHANGSDAPTPYTLDANGITLPAGDVFPDNGHVNVRTSGNIVYNIHFESKCITRTDAECAGARHEQAQYIGKSILPWSVLNVPAGQVCFAWVQVSHYNEHFGEQSGPIKETVGPDCATGPVKPEDPKNTPDPTPIPTAEPEPPVETEEPTPTDTPEEPAPSPSPSETPDEPLNPAGGSNVAGALTLAGLAVVGGGSLILLARRKAASE